MTGDASEQSRTDLPAEEDLREIWAARARKYGARCAVSLKHNAAEYRTVTARQKEVLFPLLAQQLQGGEETLLDFGCGPGRFSEPLARMTGLNVVAFDICSELIALAPPCHGVRFVASSTEEFFASIAAPFDVIWVCLVFGGCPRTCSALSR